MIDLASAKARLADAKVPKGVLYVLKTLQDKGHQAVLVGGCVRDCLLQRELKDWDLATSALPQEVQAAFRKTIPTGIEHGTVTVLAPGGPKTPVEVTTFRGDEGYVDGRRPTSVRFLDSLHEDLARRDFTINAMAYDPIAQDFQDPFQGLEDLRERKIRAVGPALVRFEEDGLRTMRALRFAATLQFSLEADTARALAPRAEVLAKVSRERIRVELEKMLGADTPASSLRWMWSSGIWEVVLGQASRPQSDLLLEEVLAHVDRLAPGHWILRLAALLWRLRDDPKAWGQALDGLRPSRQDKRALAGLLSPASQSLHASELSDLQMRQAFVSLSPDAVQGAIALAGWDTQKKQAFDRAVKGCPAGPGELAVSAKDLMRECEIEAGPRLGECLRELLAWVILDLSRNEPVQLYRHARWLLHTRSSP